jgi:hypothetical protein
VGGGIFPVSRVLAVTLAWACSALNPTFRTDNQNRVQLMVYYINFSKGVPGEERLVDDAQNTVSSRAAPRGCEEA